EIGEIVLARFGEDHIRITFSDGTLALKLASLKTVDILDKRFEVSLKTPNWIDLIDEEVQYGASNTIPMLDSCQYCNIDELTDYDVANVSRPDSPVEA